MIYQQTDIQEVLRWWFYSRFEEVYLHLLAFKLTLFICPKKSNKTVVEIVCFTGTGI